MRMSDIVSSLGLSTFPIIGMMLFLSVFVGVIVHVNARRRRDELDAAAHLPLLDDHANTPTNRESHP
jgi:cbb3-type cytochrome oxidase subunit 3